MMDERAMQHLIPPELVGKKDVLFGNLDQIYAFHHEYVVFEIGCIKFS